MLKIQGKSGLAILGVIVALVIVLSLMIVPQVNKIPRLDENVTAAWSQVSNQYQRRADLVPNLVSIVQGYASHEKEVLTSVVEARAKVGQMTLPGDILTNPQAFAKFQSAQSALSSALSRLMVVVERYPDLKANQNFLALQSQVEGVENRIAVARRDYILAVQQYNTNLRTIPGRWVAAVFYPDMKVKQNFSASAQAETAPQIKFK